MGFDDEFGSGGLEAYTSLDADDGVAHVGIAANGIGGTNLLNLLDGSHLIVIRFIVHGYNLTLVEGDAQQGFLLLCGDMLQISLFRQSLGGVEQFATADAGAPDAHVVGIFQFGEVGRESVFVQIVHLFLSREFLVAGEGDNLHTGSHHEEGHVEADLVVAGTC